MDDQTIRMYSLFGLEDLQSQVVASLAGVDKARISSLFSRNQQALLQKLIGLVKEALSRSVAPIAGYVDLAEGPFTTRRAAEDFLKAEVGVEGARVRKAGKQYVIESPIRALTISPTLRGQLQKLLDQAAEPLSLFVDLGDGGALEAVEVRAEGEHLVVTLEPGSDLVIPGRDAQQLLSRLPLSHANLSGGKIAIISNSEVSLSDTSAGASG